MTELEKYGFTGPYTYCKDQTVVGYYRTHPYHIHATETPQAWEALQTDIANGAIAIAPYVEPVVVPINPISALKKEIFFLESQITPRRLREAVLGREELVDLADGTGRVEKWLTLQENKILALREKIRALSS